MEVGVIVELDVTWAGVVLHALTDDKLGSLDAVEKSGALGVPATALKAKGQRQRNDCRQIEDD